MYKYKLQEDEYILKKYDGKALIRKDSVVDLDNANCACGKKCVISIILIALSAMIFFIFYESYEQKTCLGDMCLKRTCEAIKENFISGTLCMDACIYKKVKLDSCLTSHPESNYRLYLIDETNDLMVMCNIEFILSEKNLTKIYDYPIENTSLIDFQQEIVDFLMRRINYEYGVNEIANRIIDFVDVNRDEKLNLAEAKTLWSLLTNKRTFYMLALKDKQYIPKIKSYCGPNLIETEHMISTYLYSIEKDSILPSVFSESYKWNWPEFNYRCKIVYGILEYIHDQDSFNPNDEFGLDSLVLCSPLEKSFGYSFMYEAKLFDFSELINLRDLQNKLSDRSCKYDTDCEYTKSCIAKCDTSTHKCLPKLAEPQIVSVCRLIKFYLLEVKESNSLNDHIDHENAEKFADFEKLLNRCFRFSNVTIPNHANYLSFFTTQKSFRDIIESPNESWDYYIEYSMLIHDLKSLLWKFIQHQKDPIRPKKVHHTTRSPVTKSTSNGKKT